MVGRALLRRELSRRLCAEPDEIPILIGPTGKPFVAWPNGAYPLALQPLAFGADEFLTPTGAYVEAKSTLLRRILELAGLSDDELSVIERANRGD